MAEMMVATTGCLTAGKKAGQKYLAFHLVVMLANAKYLDSLMAVHLAY